MVFIDRLHCWVLLGVVGLMLNSWLNVDNNTIEMGNNEITLGNFIRKLAHRG